MVSAATRLSRFDLGRVVERTLASIGRNFAVFLLLTLLLAGLPALLTGSLFALAALNGGSSAVAGADATNLIAVGVSAIGLVTLVGSIAGFILQAAIVYGVIADLNGRRAEFAECLSSGLRNWFWLLLLAIVIAVCEVFGFILLIVPGLMMAVAWMVAVPAQVVERTGVFGAMSRSAELTRGHRWSIFGLLVIYVVASGAIQAAISATVTTLAVGLSPATAQAATHLIAQPLLSVATSLVGAAGVASIYYELRSTREGIGPEALAAVFD